MTKRESMMFQIVEHEQFIHAPWIAIPELVKVSISKAKANFVSKKH